jgi:dihydroneopterin aldolase
MRCARRGQGLRVDALRVSHYDDALAGAVRPTPLTQQTPYSMDIIFLRDLRIETIIGIYDWERRIKQTVSLDLEMGADIRKAAASDRIDDTLNYKAVAKRLIEFVGASEYQLVETLAERIAELVLGEFQVPWLRLTVNKTGAVRGARDVGIVIERGAR